MRWLLAILCTVGIRAQACDLALVLAVDISGSVDPDEYTIQMRGLADGLRDGAIAEALVGSKAAVSLVQWTGASRQEMSVPWVRVETHEDVFALADQIERTPRAWRNFSTAIGEALGFSLPFFDEVPDCERRIIDVSGDGISNEGRDPVALHEPLKERGITVNALVIEGAEVDLTGYFWENVITGPGAFVVTANGFDEYPARMRLKLLREVTKPISARPQRPFVIPAAVAIPQASENQN